MAGAPREKGVLEVVAVEGPPSENAGFGVDSPLGAGALLKREGVCDCAPPAAAPNNGLAAASAAGAGAAGSAGFELPNMPPPAEGAGAAPPKKPPVGCGAAGVVDAAVAGVAEAGFAAPKRLLGGFDPGGGPAGVVELLPNKEPPTGPGVAVEAPPPNNPPLAGWPVVVDSEVLLGVWLPLPNNGLFSVPPVFKPPKLKPELPPEGALVAAALPKDGVAWPFVAFEPNGEGEALVPADEAPTFPKRPPPDALLSLLAPNALPAVPKRLPPDAPVEGGPPKENDMVRWSRC